jgi:hypothetical protein
MRATQTSISTLCISAFARQTLDVVTHDHALVLLFLAIVATFLTIHVVFTAIYSITYGVYIMFSWSVIAYQSLRDKLSGNKKAKRPFMYKKTR